MSPTSTEIESTATPTSTRAGTETVSPATDAESKPDNPFQSDPIKVGYVVEDDAKNRSYEQAVLGAISYWNSSSAGSYDANYTYVSDTERAQIRIHFVDEITYCDGYDNSTVGCAPVLEKFDTTSVPASVEVEDDYSISSTRKIIIHELGHTRGLVHENRYALPIMNATIDTVLIPKTDLQNRSYGWNTTDFRVYFDTTGSVSSAEVDEYRQEIREGWQYWTEETDHVEKDIDFRFVDDRQEANVVVKIRDRSGVRWEYWMLNQDSDQNMEVYQNATLYVGEQDPELIDYNTASALGYLLLNVENEEKLPEPFDGDDEYGDTERWTD